MLKLDKFYYCRCRCQSIDFPAVTLNDQIDLPSATLENNKHSPVFIQNKTSNEKNTIYLQSRQSENSEKQKCQKIIVFLFLITPMSILSHNNTKQPRFDTRKRSDKKPRQYVTVLYGN